MQDYAEAYATFVTETYEAAKKQTKDALLCIEQSLDMTDWIPEGFGTGDAVIIADGALHIIDLKYGKGVPVTCTNNKQMMLYALGALAAFDTLYDITTTVMTIYQPRIDNISTWETPVKTLRAWAETELKPKAAQAFAGEGDYTPGEHCRFCRAKARCKTLATHNLELARYDFEDPALLTDGEISDSLTRADMFKNWINTVEDFALREAVDSGKQWPGFKLVEGRSNRIYLDESRVSDTLLANGYPEETIFKKSLLTITNMEKTLTKKTFNTLLGDLIIKPQGKPVLVPETDKRPPFSSSEAAAKDFQQISNDPQEEN
jgi:hypothetical protein